MLDNVAGLLLTVSLLAVVFEFPTQFALQYMVPGTAIGVLVGDLLFFWLAFRLARSTGRNTVTAMPLGLDTPSTFGMVFFVLGPAFTDAKATMPVDAAALHTWHIGICAIFISGVFKSACAFGSNWIRRVIPRAGLLGSLAAMPLVLISFLPLVEVLQTPVVGLVALSIILTTLIGRVRMPWNLPGTLVALIVAGSDVSRHELVWLAGIIQPTDQSPRRAASDGLDDRLPLRVGWSFRETMALLCPSFCHLHWRRLWAVLIAQRARQRWATNMTRVDRRRRSLRHARRQPVWWRDPNRRPTLAIRLTRPWEVVQLIPWPRRCLSAARGAGLLRPTSM